MEKHVSDKSVTIFLWSTDSAEVLMKRWQFKRYFLLRDRSFLSTIIYLRKKFFFTFRLCYLSCKLLRKFEKNSRIFCFEIFTWKRHSSKFFLCYVIRLKEFFFNNKSLSIIYFKHLIFIWKICYFALLYLLVREFEYLTLNNALNRGRGGITRMKINFACIINEREISAFKTVSIGT